eukprot:364641-Chlamydomonas_euryale.AAC.11
MPATHARATPHGRPLPLPLAPREAAKCITRGRDPRRTLVRSAALSAFTSPPIKRHREPQSTQPCPRRGLACKAHVLAAGMAGWGHRAGRRSLRHGESGFVEEEQLVATGAHKCHGVQGGPFGPAPPVPLATGFGLVRLSLSLSLRLRSAAAHVRQRRAIGESAKEGGRGSWAKGVAAACASCVSRIQKDCGPNVTAAAVADMAAAARTDVERQSCP